MADSESFLGQTVTHYRILEKLGGGGMGVVHKGEDTRLRRFVALKFLTEQIAHDRATLDRFEREAQAASALDHPNICTIYEIGEHERKPFIAMQFLEGQTLKHLISSLRPLPLEQVIELGVEIADALDAAHAQGIIHRDIKPANIFGTKRGHAKVLDFGLAKLSRVAAGVGVSDLPTVTADEQLTSPGTIVGTVAYMSPEQVRGQELDARTDLFSLGVVLYEMATGSLPFRGDTSGVIFEAILNRTPVAPVRLNPALPPKLEEILERALEKDRNLRYQHASDIRAEFQRLKRDSDSNRSALAVPANVTPTTKIVRRVSNVWKFALPAMAGVAAIALAALLYLSRTSRRSPAEYLQLTNFPDSVTQPALSPDGRMLAFVRGDSTFLGPGEIYVKMLPSGEPVQLTHDNLPKMSPVFSPDGSRIGYTVLDGSFGWDTSLVPVLGGKEQLWLPNASGLTWIDPQRLLFSEVKGGEHMAIVTSSESRAEPRDVYVPQHERGMAHRSYLSPDGNSALVVEMDNGEWLPCRVVPFKTNSAGKQVGPAGAPCTSAAWSPDGHPMVARYI